MKLYFKKDYRGRETAMREYIAGQTDDFGVAQALELIKLGVAEEVEETAPPVAEPTPAPKRKRKAEK
jgi:hypothetical protein